MDRHDLDGYLDAMFRSDARGRLTGNAPHLYVLRAPDFVICRCHVDLPDNLADGLQDLAAQPRGRQSQWGREYGRYLSALASFAPPSSMSAGPLYAFPDPCSPKGSSVSIDRTNADLLKGVLEEWLPDAENGRPMAAALADGQAASVCASVRISAAAHCAGVETAPRYRGRGLASQAVAGWAILVRSRGAEPYYATSFDNVASQGVARRLGLKLIGGEFSVRCGPD